MMRVSCPVGSRRSFQVRMGTTEWNGKTDIETGAIVGEMEVMMVGSVTQKKRHGKWYADGAHKSSVKTVNVNKVVIQIDSEWTRRKVLRFGVFM